MSYFSKIHSVFSKLKNILLFRKPVFIRRAIILKKSPFLLFFLRYQRVFFLFFGALFLLVFFGFILPNVKKGVFLSRDDLVFPVIIQDRNGREIHRSFARENRQWVDLESIPKLLQTITVTAEDRRFYYHFGIDFFGIMRAMMVNIQEGEWEQGASTLSQQIARKVFLADEKTFSRKFKEMMIALGIELANSKDDVLEMYLNVAPYGPRINGVDVAANVYFQKDLVDLTEAEMFVLAMLPQNPVVLSRKSRVGSWLGICSTIEEECTPFSDNYSKSRIENILAAVAKKEKWSLEKVKSIRDELTNMHIPSRKDWAHSDFQHFRFLVQDFLDEKNYKPENPNQGLVIKTSLDADLQEELLSLIREEMPEITKNYGIENIALLILDNETRSPIVWIGSRSFWEEEISGQIDMLRSSRQTGSVIKPFVYAAAIAKGFEPPTILYDSVLSFGNGGRSVYNSDGEFLGGIRMTDALAKSRNIPAIKAFFLAGGESEVRDFLDKTFGFSVNSDFPDHIFGWTLALGTVSVRLETLANAYAALGTGIQKEICPILSIATESGEPLLSPCDFTEKLSVDASTPFFLGNILSNIEARPPISWRNNITIPNFNIAVKTGTSSTRINGVLYPIDNWIVGYTPKNTFLIWAGNTDGSILKTNSYAVFAVGPLWRAVVEKFYAKYPESYALFSQPDGLQEIQGEWASTEYAPPLYTELTKYLRWVPELGINPFLPLSQEKTTE